jgi:hypothetical protein
MTSTKSRRFDYYEIIVVHSSTVIRTPWRLTTVACQALRSCLVAEGPTSHVTTSHVTTKRTLLMATMLIEQNEKII